MPAATKNPEPEEVGPKTYPIVHGFGGLTSQGQSMIMELMQREKALYDPKKKNPLMHHPKPSSPAK